MATPPTKGRQPRTVKPDFSLLTDDDKLRLQEEALEAVIAEKRAAALDEYKRVALEEARREGGVEEEMVTFTLDLAEFADRITIDGVIYFHNRQYTVPYSKYKTMTEMAYRTHTHQLEIDGKSRTRWLGFNDPRSNVRQITPHGVINTSKLARA